MQVSSQRRCSRSASRGRLGLAVAVALLLISPPALRAATTLTNGIYSWTQENGPNSGSEITTGTVGGATFNVASDDTTGTVTFPQTVSGGTFDDQVGVLSVLIGDELAGTRAVNLPFGANINADVRRRGLSVGWTGGTVGGAGAALTTPVLPNGPGDDFVVFESGSAGIPEGMMVRVRVANDIGGPFFTDWYYFAPASEEPGSPVLHAYVYDLSDFGLAADHQIDRIEIANLVADDRIDAVGTMSVSGSWLAEGAVLPEVGGAYSMSNPGPDPGPNASFTSPFGNSTFDPDPLYVAAFHDLEELNLLAPSVTCEFELRTPAVLGPAETVRVYLDVTTLATSTTGIGARLSFDKTKFTYTGIAPGSGVPGSWSFVFTDTSTAGATGEVDFVITDVSPTAAVIAGPVTDLEAVCLTFERIGIDCTPGTFGYNLDAPGPGAPSAAFPENHYVLYTDTSSMTVESCAPALVDASGPTVDDHAFVRGNVNDRAAHRLDISDVTDIANFLFGTYTLTFDCVAAFDTNNDGAHNITDLVTAVQGIFNSSAVQIAPPNGDDPGTVSPGVYIPGVVAPNGGTIPSVLGCEDGETCP